jgi:hypothetical protein
MNPISEQNIWLGKALCALSPTHHQFAGGYRGAIFVFVCASDEISGAVEQICRECSESNLTVIGLDYLYNRAHMEREPTEYERGLIGKLASYPVQFEDIHFYKADG